MRLLLDLGISTLAFDAAALTLDMRQLKGWLLEPSYSG